MNDRSPPEEFVDVNQTVGVIDGFVTNRPGYVGPLIFAVYGYPETYTLYAYDDRENGILPEVDRVAEA